MTLKKFLCVVLSFVMVCCALINVSAEESLCDKVGSPKIYHLTCLLSLTEMKHPLTQQQLQTLRLSTSEIQ